MKHPLRIISVFAFLFLLYASFRFLHLILQFHFHLPVSGLEFISFFLAVILFIMAVYIFSLVFSHFDRRDLPIFGLCLYLFFLPIVHGLFYLKMLRDLGLLQELFFYFEFKVDPKIFLQSIDPAKAYQNSPVLLDLKLFWHGVELFVALYLNWLQKGRVKSPPLAMNKTLPIYLIRFSSLTFTLIFIFLISTQIFSHFFLKYFSGDFLRIKHGELISVHKIYQKKIGLEDKKIIHLIPMMHIAKEKFYKDIQQGIPKDRSLFLIEGVTDQEGLLSTKLDYAEMAAITGLASQAKMFEPHKLGYKVKHADIDIATMNSASIKELSTMALNIKSPQAYFQNWFHGFQISFDSMRTQVHSNLIKQIRYDLLERRNATLMQNMYQALEEYQTVVIPWGALHMREIEEVIQAHGFVKTLEKERALFNIYELEKKIKKANGVSEQIGKIPSSEI